MADSMDPKLVDVRTVAGLLNLHHESVLRMCRESRLPHYRLGDGPTSPVRFSMAEINQWLASNHQGAGKKGNSDG